ncbi:Negative regulator of mitosis [Schizosaccharomyces pombe]
MLELKTNVIQDPELKDSLDLQENDRVEIIGDAVHYIVNDHLNRVFNYTVDQQKIHAALITTFASGKKAIVVILDDIGYVYYVGDNNNDSYIINVPFSTESAWSSPSGLYLQRHRSSDENLNTDLPHIFCLNDPLDELTLIKFDGKKTLSLFDSIVYVVGEIVVTHNKKEKKLSFWRSRFIDPEPDQSIKSSRNRRRESSFSREKNPDLTRSDSIHYTANTRLSEKFEEQGLAYSTIFSHIESFPITGSTSFDSILGNGVLVITTLVKELEKGYMMLFRLVRDRSPYFLDSLQLHAINLSAIKSKHLQKIVVLSSKGKVSLESPMSPSLPIEGTFRSFRVHGATLYLEDTDGVQRYISLDNRASNSLVKWCLNVIRYVLPLREYEIFYTGHLYALFAFKLSHDEAFISSILACFTFFSRDKVHVEPIEDCNEAYSLSSKFHFKKEILIASQLSSHLDYSTFKNYLMPLAITLHFISEELRLDSVVKPRKDQLVALLLQITTWLKWPRYCEYYNFDVAETFISIPLSIQVDVEEPVGPTSILQWIIECLRSQSTVPFYGLESYGLPHSCSTMFPQTLSLMQLLDCLLNPNMTLQNLVEEMVRLGISRKRCERYPFGILCIIFTVLEIAAEEYSPNWESEELRLVNRLDVDSFLHPKTPKWVFNKQDQEVKEIKALTSTVTDSTLVDTQSFHPYKVVTDMIFREDRRLAEVNKLLNYSSQITIMTEHFDVDLSSVPMQQKVAQCICVRTLSVPIGAGMLTYGSKNPLPTEKVTPRLFNFTLHLHPGTLIIQPNKEFVTQELTEWPEFNVGVALGLSISKFSKEINTSWIMFNRPETLTAYHAGFLFGLGLNGHLKALATWHSFIYLTSKHDTTSIGLLLGLASSYLGSMDAKVTKLLSVHISALLPVGSNELNISPLTQTAGILGIGLLFHDSCHRRMSEVTMEEILASNESELKNEGYKLAAGFSLGLINLGRGSNLPGMSDLKLVSRLQVGISSQATFQSLEAGSPGAIMALTMIYMKTNDLEVAKKIDIPKSRYLLDFYRPDLILLRVAGKNLIMWDEVKADYEWVKYQIPDIMLSQFDLQEKKVLSSDDLLLYNVLAGICFSLGLRFAGTGNPKAKEILINFLDSFIRLCHLPAKTHDERVTAVTVIRCTQIVALSSSCVMAGYCDLDVLRRLRVLHGRMEPVNYGAQMATHMALGILSLGGGRYSLSRSNLAIAALLISFYPQFPRTTQDNRAHLQAARNLWALAVEERCIIPRNQDTKQPCIVPLNVVQKSGAVQKLEAPILLPPYDSISSVSTLGDKYWNLKIDLDNNSDYRELLRESQTLTLMPYDRTSSKEEPLNLFPKLKDTSSPLWNLVKTSRLFQSSNSPLNVASLQESNNKTSLGVKLLLSMDFDNLTRDRLLSLQILLQFFESCWTGVLLNKFHSRQYLFLSRDLVEDLSLRVWEYVYSHNHNEESV